MNRKVKYAFIASLIAVNTIFAVGCSKSGAGANDKNEPAFATNTVVESGVSITISTDKLKYKEGDEVNYTVTFENNNVHYKVDKVKFDYSNTAGLNPKEGTTLPCEVPILDEKESFSLSGVLVGDVSKFPETTIIGSVDSEGNIVAYRGEAETLNPKHLLGGANFAEAAAFDKVMIRPYLKFEYAGHEVTIRMVIELHLYQKYISVDSGKLDNPKKITCHDPSIFKDVDGKYYIFGSFLAGGYTEDLKNWTNIEKEFQGSFTSDVKKQIRAWNKDESAKSWNDYIWAPDIVYNPVMEKYCMYISANGDDWKSNIVLCTSDKVDGPYEYAGTIVYGGFDTDNYAETDAPMVTGENTIPERYVTHGIKNKRWGDRWPNCIDPCVFSDDNGKLFISYGSWSGGIFMLELDENTGLRDYSVTYEENAHSDPYFGKKIAGGAYVSGEASYIQKVGDYYYLFISYGNLEAAGGYNVRIFRSTSPDGDYVDALGNDAFSDSYVYNYNSSKGVRLFGGYKWRSFVYGQVAQGHNSAFVDDDGKAYMVFHTRTTNGSEYHYVKVHQLFTTKEGWLVAAPYQTSGESLKEGGYSKSEIAGEYDVILHELDINFKNMELNKPKCVFLNEDGTIIGDYEGSWSTEDGTSYISLNIGGTVYSGVALKMPVENTTIETMVFTALGDTNQLTIWGSKIFE